MMSRDSAAAAASISDDINRRMQRRYQSLIKEWAAHCDIIDARSGMLKAKSIPPTHLAQTTSGEISQH